jgi:hypothetical protein
LKNDPDKEIEPVIVNNDDVDKDVIEELILLKRQIDIDTAPIPSITIDAERTGFEVERDHWR